MSGVVTRAEILADCEMLMLHSAEFHARVRLAGNVIGLDRDEATMWEYVMISVWCGRRAPLEVAQRPVLRWWQRA